VTGADLLRFAAHALHGHRLRTGLSILGVAIGVASVIALTSLGEGARLYVMGEFAQLGSSLLIVIPGKTETTGSIPILVTAPHDLTLEDCAAIRARVPKVRYVAPMAMGAATARNREKSREVTVLGTTADFTRVRRLSLARGQFLPAGELGRDERVCIIGRTVREELYGNRSALGEFIRVGGYRFRIIGELAPVGVAIGGNMDEMVFVPVVSCMRMFNRSGLFRIFADMGAHEELPAAKKKVIEILKERHDGEEDVTLFTQDSVLATLTGIIGMLTAALAGIAAISLAVAGIGIMNVMLVSVSERTREIGLLKALGATRTQIAAVFLAEAAMLSLVGGALGLALGLGAGRALQYVYPVFPAQPPEWAVVAAVAVSLGVGLVFGAIPARRAARLDPIAALARR